MGNLKKIYVKYNLRFIALVGIKDQWIYRRLRILKFQLRYSKLPNSVSKFYRSIFMSSAYHIRLIKRLLHTVYVHILLYILWWHALQALEALGFIILIGTSTRELSLRAL